MIYDFKVEAGVPLPSKNNHVSVYPWRDMEIGDSIFVPKDHTKPSSVRTAAMYFSKRNPEFKFSCHRSYNPDGCRVWRVAVDYVA